MTDAWDERPPAVEPVRRTVRPEETVAGAAGYAPVDEHGDPRPEPTPAQTRRATLAAIAVLALLALAVVLAGLAGHALFVGLRFGWRLIP